MYWGIKIPIQLNQGGAGSGETTRPQIHFFCNESFVLHTFMAVLVRNDKTCLSLLNGTSLYLTIIIIFSKSFGRKYNCIYKTYMNSWDYFKFNTSIKAPALTIKHHFQQYYLIPSLSSDNEFLFGLSRVLSLSSFR